MARAPAGPRRIDSSGTYYAVKRINGKKQYISLGTKIKSEALRLWPAAQAQLEELAHPQPIKPGTNVFYIDDLDTGKGHWEVEPHDYEPEDVVTWEQSIEVAAKRRTRRTGVSPSSSWLKSARYAIKLCGDIGPEDITAKDIRRVITNMEAQGLSSTTIAQRMAVLSGLMTSLIKTGAIDRANPFSQVDYSAAVTNHHPTATPEQYKQIADGLGSLRPGTRLVVELILWTGARVGEACHAPIEDGKLAIRDTLEWRPKNRASHRTLPIPPQVDLRPAGARPGEGQVREALASIAPGVTPHQLRHGWRTAARVAGADELLSEKLLGHAAGSEMSRVYGQTPPALLQGAAEQVWTVIDSWAQGH